MGLGGTLQELKTEGVLSLYHDYRSGTLRDWSGNGDHGVATLVNYNKQGLNFVPTNGYVSVADSVYNRIIAGTLIAFGDFNSMINYEVLISKRDATGTVYQLGIQSTGAYFFDSAIRALGISSAGKKCIACNFATGSPPAFYYNGIYAGVAGSNCSVTSRTVPVYFGNFYSGTYPLKSVLKGIVIVSRQLTATEHAEVCGQLENTTWNTKGLAPGALLPGW